MTSSKTMIKIQTRASHKWQNKFSCRYHRDHRVITISFISVMWLLFILVRCPFEAGDDGISVLNWKRISVIGCNGRAVEQLTCPLIRMHRRVVNNEKDWPQDVVLTGTMWTCSESKMCLSKLRHMFLYCRWTASIWFTLSTSMQQQQQYRTKQLSVSQKQPNKWIHSFTFWCELNSVTHSSFIVCLHYNSTAHFN